MEPLKSSRGRGGHEDGPMQGLRLEDKEERPEERRQTEVEMPLVRVITDDQVQQDSGTSQGVPQLVAIEGHAGRDTRAQADHQKARKRLLDHIAHAPAGLRGALRAWLHRRERDPGVGEIGSCGSCITRTRSHSGQSSRTHIMSYKLENYVQTV